MQNLTPADIYAELYKTLFKLSPRLEQHLANILDAALPTPQHKLVCIHVRMGHNAFKSDYQVV